MPRRPTRHRRWRLAPEALEDRTTPNAGGLDPGFGAAGEVILPTPTDANGIAFQTDGKAVVGTSSFNAADDSNTYTLTRLNPDGSVDTGFGTGGTVTIVRPFQPTFNGVVMQPQAAGITALAVDPATGKVVLATSILQSASVSRGDFIAELIRLQSDGTPDKGFGTGGIAYFDITPTNSRAGNISSILFQPGGQFVAAADNAGVVLYRVSDAGTLDASFGTGGLVRMDDLSQGSTNNLRPLQAAPGGGFEFAHYFLSSAAVNSSVQVRRFTADGTPDAAFGANGVVSLPRSVLGDLTGFSADPTTGDMLLVGPNTQVPDAERQAGGVQAIHLHADGSIDAGYGGSGSTLVFPPLPADQGNGVTGARLLPDGSALVSAYGNDVLTGQGRFALARLLPDGTFDPSFGADGIATVRPGDFVAGFGFGVRPGLGYELIGRRYDPGTPTSHYVALGLEGTSPTPTLTVSPGALPGGTLGTPYAVQLTAAGGPGPVTYFVAAGDVPRGTTLSAGGLISGTPLAAGDFDFTVAVEGTAGAFGGARFRVHVDPVPVVPPPSPPPPPPPVVLPVINPAEGPTHTTTQSSVVTVNPIVTQVTVPHDTQYTRIVVADNNFMFAPAYDTQIEPGEYGFIAVIPGPYDPSSPAVQQAIAAAEAYWAAAQRVAFGPGAPALVATPAAAPIRVPRGATSSTVETGHTDVVTGTDTTATVGPATIRTGENLLQPYTVYAGVTNTDTLSHVRRDTAETTTTDQAFDVFQDVFVGPAVGPRGASTFSSSTKSVAVYTPQSATTTAQQAATRVVGTLDGVVYDVTIPKAYDPTDPDIRAAIAAAVQAATGAGAVSTTTAVGSPVSVLTSTTRTTTDTFVSEQDVFGPNAASTVTGPVAVNTGTELRSEYFIPAGNRNTDVLDNPTTTYDRLTTTAQTFTATTTVQVVGQSAAPAAPPHVYLRAVGAGAGAGPRVIAYRADGSEALDVFAFEPTFTGGVRVATADVTGDGTDDVLVAAGDGGGPRVRVFDGATGATVADFFAFDDTLRVGAFVAAAPIPGADHAAFAVTPGAGGGPRVAVFDGHTFQRLTADFLAFAPAGREGYPVALGDFAGTGALQVAVGARAAGGTVAVFDLGGAELARTTAFEPAFAGGVNLAAGDFAGTGGTDLIVGAGAGGGPRVRAFALSAGGLAEVGNGFSFDGAARGGAAVGVAVTPAGARVQAAFAGRVRSAAAGVPTGMEEAPFGPGYLGGVWVS